MASVSLAASTSPSHTAFERTTKMDHRTIRERPLAALLPKSPCRSILVRFDVCHVVSPKSEKAPNFQGLADKGTSRNSQRRICRALSPLARSPRDTGSILLVRRLGNGWSPGTAPNLPSRAGKRRSALAAMTHVFSMAYRMIGRPSRKPILLRSGRSGRRESGPGSPSERSSP